MPFDHPLALPQGIDPAHEWARPYAEAVDVLAGAGASLARLRAWAAAQRAAGPAAVFRARALLVLAVYQACWLRGAPCEILSTFLAAPEMRADLDLSPLDARLLGTLCRGQESCPYAAEVGAGVGDLRYLFSAESLAPELDTPTRGALRSAFVHALAVMLGVPPAQNYYRSISLDPWNMDCGCNSSQSLPLTLPPAPPSSPCSQQ